MHKNILLTFDYELFLGNLSGSVEKCLLYPTKRIIDILNYHDIKGVFFVDTIYLKQLKTVSVEFAKAREDYDKILLQLRQLITDGHYIFHHIHPHWLDAKYLSKLNQWNLSNKDKFALNNLSEFEVTAVFNFSNDIITEIYEGSMLPEAIGFRAGGLYAQPFSIYEREMSKHNILLDFNVLKGSKSTSASGTYKFDYAVAPDQAFYKFSIDQLVKDSNGKYTEITMDQLTLQGLSKIINGIYYRLNKNKEKCHRIGDGTASGNVVTSSANKLFSKFSSSETFSIELLNSYKISLYLNALKITDFIQLISHPKLFSLDNINSFNEFIQKTKSKYTVETDLFKILKNSNTSIK